MKPRITSIIELFNKNYNTNHPLIIEYLNSYIHSSHRISSLKMDGVTISYQPSYPDLTVKSYRVYYDDSMSYAHKSGRIVIYFTDGTMAEIGLYKFKRYIRRHGKIL